MLLTCQIIYKAGNVNSDSGSVSLTVVYQQ